MTDEERIKDIYRKYWDGMIRKDTDLLRSLMSDDYCLRLPFQLVRSRQFFSLFTLQSEQLFFFVFNRRKLVLRLLIMW